MYVYQAMIMRWLICGIRLIYVVIMKVELIISKVYFVVLNVARASLNTALGGKNNSIGVGFEKPNPFLPHAFSHGTSCLV